MIATLATAIAVEMGMFLLFKLRDPAANPIKHFGENLHGQFKADPFILVTHFFLCYQMV